METISNLAAAASKAIYGEQTTSNSEVGKEPISGETGKGTVDSPYDQGNATNPISASTHPTSNTITKTDDTTSPNTDDTTPSKTETTLPDRTASDTDKMSSNPSNIPTNPNNAAEGGPPEPHQDTEKTGVVGGHGDPFVTSDKSTESSSNPGPVSSEPKIKQQGAANPNDSPTGEEKSAIKDTKEDAEDFLKTKDPNDHSGEPMHMHNGGPDESSESNEVPKTQAERRDSSLGQPGGQEHGKEEEEGTGEQWVKTSGIAADGGDFDATKPGAGREANRLMEEKGIHKTEPGKPAPPPDVANGHKAKVPLGQKIKDKLHIGSHKE